MAVEVQPKPWTTTGEERRLFVRSMFGRIAPTYDLLNSLITAGAHRRWRRHAVRMLALKPGESALDVCCGTGEFASELLAAGAGQVTAVDFSEPMLAIAAKKRLSRTPSVTWLLADALRLPLPAASVDAVTVGWGLRNLPDLETGLREMFRVLRPGGRFVSLDMAIPRGPVGWCAGLYCRRIVPQIGALIGNREAYTYLPNSVYTYPDREKLVRMATCAGFSDIVTRDFAFGAICIHRGVKA